MTAVQPGGRFGTLDIQEKTNVIQQFAEKRKEDGGWINAGFMVIEPDVFNYIEGDQTTFEREPLEKLSAEGQVVAYQHNGFWQCMDTLKDKQQLDEMWRQNRAPWRIWDK